MPRLLLSLRLVHWPTVARAGAIVAALAGAVALFRAEGLYVPAASWAPETGSGRAVRTLATATRSMVSTSNPYATEAGLEMLRGGGSAADAAIAVQLVLTLVEPQSSGLGGGGFALHFDAMRRELSSYDGRETAPAAARPDRFLVGGRPMAFRAAAHSGLGVGTPGLPGLLWTLHAKHGRLAWARLFEPAIRLARSGFVVSPRLHLLLAWMGPASFEATARAHFYDAAGRAWPVGHRLANPALAATLERLAAEGANGFYRGPIAEAIVKAVRTAPGRAGDLAPADLAGYAVKERPPVCVDYRRHSVCGMGPPSSGAIAIGQVLRLLEPFDLGRGPRAAMGPGAMHLIAEAEKLAFADRDYYVGDPDAVEVPAGLLDARYLDDRRDLVSPIRAMARPAPGTPPGKRGARLGDGGTHEIAGTSHVSIVDPAGNAVALTASIEAAFGARIMVAGFLLNNQLTDFSFRPRGGAGRPVANAVAPGKRPRSSMSPTIVLDAGGRLRYVLGSTGGSGIIPYTVQALVALIDWELDAQAAAGQLHFGSRGGTVDLELGGRTVWHALRLRPYGHRLGIGAQTSGTHIVAVREGRLEGGADPRKEGVARGD
jgi:gamma-glutamyltranspeptidase/glutathione hydrolase